MARTQNPYRAMKSIYARFFKTWRPEDVLPLVDNLLSKYPLYAEAWLFKARLLAMLSRDREALLALEKMESADPWRLAGKFDKVELLFALNRPAAARRELAVACESYLHEIAAGLRDCLDLLSKREKRRFVKLLSTTFAASLSEKYSEDSVARFRAETKRLISSAQKRR